MFSRLRMSVKRTFQQQCHCCNDTAQMQKKGNNLGLMERHAHLKEALYSLQTGNMQTDCATLARLLKECSVLNAFIVGKQIHAHIKAVGLETNLYLGNLLISMYKSWGFVKDAEMTFDSMPERDVVSWTALISAHALTGCGVKSLKVYKQMLQEGISPNKVTFVSVLNACRTSSDLIEGRKIHASIVDHGLQSDVVVGTSLVNMYARCGNLKQGREFFDQMPQKDMIAWNTMISATVQQKEWLHALGLFQKMEKKGFKPNKVTYVSILEACAGLKDLTLGRLLSLRIIESGFENDLVLGNALMSMYSKCGSFKETRQVFEKMKARDVISWNSIILACVKHGKNELALHYFAWMEKGTLPDMVTFLTILEACSNIGLLHVGEQYHSLIYKHGYDSDILVANALVNMYAKCGGLETSRKMFEEMLERDVISWTTLITAAARHGCGQTTLALFGQMQWEDTYPNNVTFTCVFVACSHAGMVDEAQHHFASIKLGNVVQLNMDHYASMIDSLGRAGHLSEAEDIIEMMPFVPDQAIWMTLLSSCKVHGDVDRGRKAAERLMELDPHCVTPLVMISSVYAAAGRSEDAMPLVRMIRDFATKEQGTQVT